MSIVSGQMAGNGAIIDTREEPCFLWGEPLLCRLQFIKADITVPVSYQKRMKTPCTK
jgi:hypothetical protein